MKVLVIDGNNWFRNRAETDLYGNPMRRCFTEIQTANYDQVFLVWDGMGGLARRRAIYPEYKVGRVHPADNFFDMQKEFKKLCILSKAISIEVKAYEADDVVAYLVKDYLEGHDVTIESNDADFHQLGVKMTRSKAKVAAEYITTYKCCVGDPSDNIKGIKGFGKGAWEKLNTKQLAHLEVFIRHGAPPDFLSRVIDFIPKASASWLLLEENQKMIKNYLTIVNFMLPSPEEVAAGIQVGLNRSDLAHEALKQFMS